MLLKNEIVNAQMIDNHNVEIISKQTDLNDSIQRLKDIYDSTNLANKIWKIIRYYYEYEQGLARDVLDDIEILKIILVKRLRSSDYEKLESVFEIIFGTRPVSTFFAELESKTNLTGEKFIR